MAIDETTARRFLDDERSRLEEALALTDRDLAEERTGRSGELSSYDQHPAERATELADMEREEGLRSDFEARLLENEEARRRVDEGRYGICQRCGRPIDDERLEAMPSTRLCVEDAEREAMQATANAEAVAPAEPS